MALALNYIFKAVIDRPPPDYHGKDSSMDVFQFFLIGYETF